MKASPFTNIKSAATVSLRVISLIYFGIYTYSDTTDRGCFLTFFSFRIETLRPNFFSDDYISRGNRTIPDHIGTYHVNIVHLWWITNLGQARYRLFCTPNFTASETLHVFLNYFRQHDLLVPPVIKLDSPFAWSENYFVCWFQNREYFLVVVVQVVILLHFFKWQDIRNSSLVKSHCPKFRQRLFYNESYWCGVAVDFYIPPPSVTDVL